MSLKKYLLAGGLSAVLLLGACGLGEEEEGSSEEETSEETEDNESEDTGEEDADASESELEDSQDDSDSEDDSSGSEDDSGAGDDSSDSEDNVDTEDDSEDNVDTEDDSEDSGEDSGDEGSVDLDSDEDNSSIGIGGTEDLDEEDVDEESSDDAEDEDATSGEEQTKTFALEENGTYNELVYYYVDDEVKRQTSVTEMDYEAIGASNEEEAKELLSEASKEYTDTDGVDHNIEYNEDGFVETTEVNYDEADLKEVAGLDGAEFEGEESANFVSMERSEEQLLNSGYELIEGEAASDAASGSDSESASGESSAVGIDFSTITGETMTGDDTEITSMFIGNSGIAELLDNAEVSDADIEEVLKPSEEITTYFAETYMVIHAFGAGSDTPAESDVAGLSAEIDERDGFEVFSQVYDKESGKLLPNIYANPDQFAAFDGTGWVDQTGTAESEEVFYGSYSNLHEAFMENSDVIDVSEDDDYYFLYNIGDEESLHETFGSIFNVEYTGANTDEMENAVVGIVEKSSGDLVHVAYISTAPGEQNPEEMLHIEIAEQIGEYGNYDDSGVTVPDVQENPAPDEETEESGSGSEEESSGSTQDGLTVGDSAELNGMTLTVEDVSYTDERNEFAEVDADEVIMLELSFENNSGDSYLMGSRDMEVMLDGEPAETYPVGDIILDETADGESTTGTLAYAVTGDPSEIELVFSPLDAEDSAVFNITPE